ncbi:MULTISPECIES: MutS family DNA mismatch repair protein [Clostridium]|uniref:DNA repair protein n=1 Tax=Clostridium cibarium TaxID=2762247 RepID=A0ABR8PVX8_9CLOT|nr:MULTISPECIES: MutS family DNA mismatch repair protein [Clostridium]MBD7912295.1 DNA repair protein [Clostridium cibarium]
MKSTYNNYINRLKTYNTLIEEQNKSIRIIAYLRFVTLIIGLSVTYYTFSIKSYYLSIGVFTVQLLIFIYLIIMHDKEINKRKYSIALKGINEKAVKRLEGQWNSFEDDGREFKDEDHYFSNDLDIFGRNSLFQWINSTKTFMGRQNLKNRLTNPLKTPLEIKEIQESLQELASCLEWRQLFEAEGMIISNECINPEELYEWATDKNELYTKKWLILLVRLLPCVTFILIALGYFTSLVNFELICFIALVQLSLLFIKAKERNEAFQSIYKYKNNINIYSRLLSLIIEKDFKSDYLRKLKNKLVLSKDEDAAALIKKLSNIYDKISNRNNGLFMIFNVLLLWDYQCMIQFEKWRIKSGKKLKKWFHVIGEFEALNSISNIIYDNPKWAMPLISDKNYVIRAEKLGHPLLGEKMVRNDITIDKNKNILLITGSNMSGKSTFLRTIGINLVLSYIGAAVCAEKLECSLMQIFTCMRISDNLENSISSFYAEILRIKKIVKEVEKNENVFFILDELFKGTNSIDRHDGATALIMQLGSDGASGLISTHDLELCNLEHTYSKIKNYHFREYYLNDELKFDYKIREGASTTRNGKHLIRLAGIRSK